MRYDFDDMIVGSADCWVPADYFVAVHEWVFICV